MSAGTAGGQGAHGPVWWYKLRLRALVPSTGAPLSAMFSSALRRSSRGSVFPRQREWSAFG